MKALIVDDDLILADLVSFTLRRAGYTAIQAHDIPEALRVFEQEQPDLMVLDVNLPGEPPLTDGFALCRQIRTRSEVPILLLTVRADEEDVVQGLGAGADDYILKPFSPRQLVARVQAVMRRARGSQAATPASRFSTPDLDFDPRLREVRLPDGTLNKLTPLEARLLEALMLNAGRLLTVDDLISDVWGAAGGSPEMLRQLVRRLRSKIETEPATPHHIRNISGIGYGFGLEK